MHGQAPVCLDTEESFPQDKCREINTVVTLPARDTFRKCIMPNKWYRQKVKIASKVILLICEGGSIVTMERNRDLAL